MSKDNKLDDIFGGSDFQGFAERAVEIEATRSSIDMRDQLEREARLAKAQKEMDDLGITVKISDDSTGAIRALMFTEETGEYDIEWLDSLSEADLPHLPPDVRTYWERYKAKFKMESDKIDIRDVERQKRRKSLGLE